MGILIGDIGGTNSRLALADGSGITTGTTQELRNAGYAGLAPLLQDYLAALPAHTRPRRAALAVAAPVQGDAVTLTNNGWRISRPDLQAALGLDDLLLLNDFEALAWSLPSLRPQELVQIGRGTARPEAARAVLGPGTGLGVAGLVRVRGGWQALAGEGGHVTLAAGDELEERVIGLARRRFGHCSAERLLSGAGLAFLHAALHGGQELAPEAVGQRIDAGEADATATLGVFFRLLGSVAGNVALTFGALGGVYIGGGIVRRYAAAFAASDFRARFEAKGRYRDYLGEIPTWLITAQHPALTGLLVRARREAGGGY